MPANPQSQKLQKIAGSGLTAGLVWGKTKGIAATVNGWLTWQIITGNSGGAAGRGM